MINDKFISKDLDIKEFNTNIRPETLGVIIELVLNDPDIYFVDEDIEEYIDDEYKLKRAATQFTIYLNNARQFDEKFEEFDYAFYKTFKKHIKFFNEKPLKVRLYIDQVKNNSMREIIDYIEYIFRNGKEDDDNSLMEYTTLSKR